MEDLLTRLSTIFSIEYIFCNITIIYILIKIIIKVKNKYYIKIGKSDLKITKLNRETKRIITFINTIIISILFYYCFNEEPKIILCSALASIVAYDYLVKYILKLLKVK